MIADPEFDARDIAAVKTMFALIECGQVPFTEFAECVFNDDFDTIDDMLGDTKAAELAVAKGAHPRDAVRALQAPMRLGGRPRGLFEQ